MAGSSTTSREPSLLERFTRDLVGVAPPVPTLSGDDWPGRLFDLREQLQALRYALTLRSEAEALALAERASDLIQLSGGLLSLHADTAGQVGAWAYDIRARFWATVGDLCEKWEEILSGEDKTPPERFGDALSFGFNRLADTGFVQSAWAAHRASAAALRLEVSDDLWRWLPRWLGPQAAPHTAAALISGILEQIMPADARPADSAMRVMALRGALLALAVREFDQDVRAYFDRLSDLGPTGAAGQS